MKKLLCTIVKKELAGYFHSPLAFIFLVVFLLFQMGFTFVLGRFYNSNHAGLEIFFTSHPWLYLFLVPAIGMRLWAEEKSEGTIETLFTLPIPLPVIIAGKYLASWLFILIALVLTFPVVLTVYYLGSPDFGPVFSGYIMSWLMAGSFLAITCFTSALTKNQVISFVLSVIICFCFVLLGYGIFQQYLSFLPVSVTDFLTNLGFIPHFQQAILGVIDSRDVIYFISITIFFLVLNTATLEQKKVSLRRMR
jgi:ABC-2 type transport system permease protein